RFVGWRPTVTEQVTVTRGAADTVLTRYELYAFNPRGKQTGEAQCVLRRGTAATSGFFARPGRPGMVGVLAAQTATPVPEGVPPVFIGAGSTCLLDVWSWQMQCGNTTCYPQFALRVPTRTQRLGLVTDTATRAGGPTSPLIGGWECPGMGSLSLNGDGTLTFHPDGGGGGRGGGGGGSCGGGNGGGSGDSSGDGSVNPPGSGGGATSWWGASCDSIVLDAPVDCDPYVDTLCHTPLTRDDTLAIRRALSTYVRSTFTDQQAQQQCTAMRQAFEILFDQGFVKRGRTDDPDAAGEEHLAAYDPGSGEMHFDPRHLDAAHSGSPAALRDLLNSMLHEAAHALGKEHSDPVAGLYAEPYFKWLSPGVNSCIAW
ncbi:MAG TPA: hypothetical protein PKE51_00735, partial [Gemmatimonadaceae bacterium]|nr:hypothetical protein [Gemmatimonadaceae bacterium]